MPMDHAAHDELLESEVMFLLSMILDLESFIPEENLLVFFAIIDQ